jgi:predicted short-subunit dehydrogenase-like oxidoreductase (DUF2520 family)
VLFRSRALLPLTRQVLLNFERLGPDAAWTGPLSRADYNVVGMHAVALRDLPPEFGAAHEALARLGARVLARQPEEMLAALQQVFQDAQQVKKATGGRA